MKNRIIKKLIFLLIFLICYNTTVCAADSLGRLFTLPEERAQLDKWRIIQPKPPEIPLPSKDSKKDTEQPQILETPNFITFNGIILRQGQLDTIWINNSKDNNFKGFGIDKSAIRNTDLPIFLHELTSGENPQITWAKEAIYLKPAQILDTKNRKIIEKYAQESVAKTESQAEKSASTADKEQMQVIEKKEESSFFGKIKSFWKK